MEPFCEWRRVQTSFVHSLHPGWNSMGNFTATLPGSRPGPLPASPPLLAHSSAAASGHRRWPGQGGFRTFNPKTDQTVEFSFLCYFTGGSAFPCPSRSGSWQRSTAHGMTWLLPSTYLQPKHNPSCTSEHRATSQKLTFFFQFLNKNIHVRCWDVDFTEPRRTWRSETNWVSWLTAVNQF